MDTLLTDFPKLECPFIRQTFKINQDDFKQKGAQYQLREPVAYLVVNRINPGYEWVFDNPDTVAVEKLNGTNIKILIEKGRIVTVQNRKNVIDPLLIGRGQMHLMQGVFEAAVRGYIDKDGEYAGELIGPKLQGNPYKLDTHVWYPFDLAFNNLQYRSFKEHPVTFDNLSAWFKEFLFSRLYTKRASKLGLDDKVFAEGVVFYNMKRKAQQQTWRAKLRRDMFFWYYDGIEIFEYDTNGRDDIEEQGKFD